MVRRQNKITFFRWLRSNYYFLEEQTVWTRSLFIFHILSKLFFVNILHLCVEMFLLLKTFSSVKEMITFVVFAATLNFNSFVFIYVVISSNCKWYSVKILNILALLASILIVFDVHYSINIFLWHDKLDIIMIIQL